MTLSRDARLKNLEEALLILMENLRGESFLATFIDDYSPDSRILPTTWLELKRRYLVRQTSNSTRYYTLSGPGWPAGLRLLDQFDTEDMRAKTGKLCAVLKRRVKDRKFDEFALVREIAEESGLSEEFIRDAIESDLIRELFGTRGAEWKDRAMLISIPVDFGQEPL